jgi:chromosome segregation ATPase
MNGNWGIALGFLGLILAPVLTYVVATRRMSGKIATSDATDLWKESADIRDDYRDRLQHANDRQVNLEARQAALEARNNELGRENVILQGQIHACERLGDELRATITSLEATIRELTK